MKTTAIKWAAFLFALFHVYTNVFATLSELWFSAIHFGGFAALCALGFHRGPHVEDLQNAGPKPLERFSNILLALLALLVPAYLMLFENALYAREAEYIWSDYVVSGLAILLAIEFTRRTSGWFMPALILFCLAYMLFLGRYIPGVFMFPGLSLETVLYRSYFSSEGMFGSVATISATYVFMFILFGAFLLRSGAGDFIVNLARCVAGRYTGGAGMVAVIGSGLMGSVTGSAVANTVSTGVITIPMMNRVGFPAKFSAGVVASASTGGQLMPPVMGAGAFVMASYTQLPYLQIIALSTLPAILYFLTVAFFVRIEAKRLNLQPEQTEAHEKLGPVLKRGWAFVIPLAVLVGLLVVGYTPIMAAAVSILAVIVTSWLTPSPMSGRQCFEATLDAVRTMVPTALLLVAVGLVINVVNTTGIGNSFSFMIVEWADGSLLITLALIALASLVLGMGLPVTASYIVLATLSAPIVFDLISQSQLLNVLRSGDLPTSVKTTIDLFGGDAVVALKEMPLEMKQLVREQLLDPSLLATMLLSAHLIIFWLSQDSNVTPPVCLAAFAAAGIAGTKPMATGMAAWKISKGLYLVPLLFAYSPLISGSWPERIEVFVWACFGLYALAGLLQWHLERPLNLISAPLLAASAVLLTWAPLNIAFHAAGAALLFGVIFWQRREKSAALAAESSG
ncbi:TRAP transporter fused permease subunit [Proteobacteria bacterium 005FR1]|nr:TRAP transporter fused permease subunit [Proteobacteria bacterium 005FR1]